MAAPRKSIDCRNYPSEKNCFKDFRHRRRSPQRSHGACRLRTRAREHAGIASTDQGDAQGRSRLTEIAADGALFFLIRARCVSASMSSSASTWCAMSESLPDQATPTTTAGKSGNGSTRIWDGGLKPGTATVKPNRSRWLHIAGSIART